MTWIRSASWDGVWILSGAPIGLVLLISSMYIAPHTIILFSVGVIGFAHLLSPVALAWAHPELRRHALSHRFKFIGLPVLLVAAAASIGLAALLVPSTAPLDLFSMAIRTMRDTESPLAGLLLVYIVWNAYHFGMQNFGVLSIYRTKIARRSNQRIWDKSFCLVNITAATILPFVPHLPFHEFLLIPLKWSIIVLAIGSIVVMLLHENAGRASVPRIIFIITTALGPPLMLWWGFLVVSGMHRWSWLPHLPFWPLLWGFAILTLNHYLVSIGIAAHVLAQRQIGSLYLILAAIGVAGAALFAALFVDPRTLTLHVTALAISLRLGLGFVHFLYDRWLYKFSDPVVRAVIGRDLFGSPS